ncbi:MAG: helix-turn-helix domain-containing protein [Pannonibacter sp.]
MSEKRRGIQSVEIGGRLLGALMRRAQPMMLKDLAADADLAPAQAHAYLASLKRVGFVEQNPETGRYLMGPFAVRLAMARLRTIPAYREVIGAATRLGTELGLMVTVTVSGPQGATVIHRHDGVETLNVNIRMGTVYAPEGTATGRVFGAFAGDGQAANDVHRCGYAAVSDEPVPGVSAVAAPVRDAAGTLFAVLTLVASGARLALDDEAGRAARGRLLEICAEAEAALQSDAVAGGRDEVQSSSRRRRS